jgi:uncharacterized membrane protein
MTMLFLAALFLPLSHFGISSTPLRPILVERLGERPYQGFYSLVSFAALAWLIAVGARSHRGHGRPGELPLLW